MGCMRRRCHLWAEYHVSMFDQVMVQYYVLCPRLEEGGSCRRLRMRRYACVGFSNRDGDSVVLCGRRGCG